MVMGPKVGHSPKTAEEQLEIDREIIMLDNRLAEVRRLEKLNGLLSEETDAYLCRAHRRLHTYPIEV